MEPRTTETRDPKTGEWFLEAVGKAIEPAPPPSVLDVPDTAEAPTADVGTGDESDTGDTSGVTVDPTVTPETTTELVGQMWRATGTQDPLEDWEPADLNRFVKRKRNFRWSVWIMALLVIAAVTAAVLLSPRLVARQAEAEAAEYTASLNDLRATLPATQQVLRALTEPATPVDALPDLVPDLSRLQAASDAVIEVATRPLPTPLPLIPSDSLTDLEPSRDAMARLGDEAAALAGRLADAIAYRSLAAGFLDAGTLEPSTGSVAISDVQALLATTFADATAALGQLPADPAFAEHRDALTAATETYREWEPAYIDALRRGDATDAAGLIAEYETLVADLERNLVPALATLRREVDAAILELDRELVDTINGLPR